jgi:hypothetical protein
MSDGVITTPKNTTKRGRIDVCGSFTTANTSAPTSAKGDGVKARTDTGTFTVTLPAKYGDAECLLVTISGGASTAQMTYSAGVLTIITYTSGSAADTNALRVNFFATFSTRVDL